jgi:cysteine desulfurase
MNTSRPEIYLDYQSSKPVDPRVLDEMIPFFTEKFGNPSALHKVGDIATDALEESRREIAKFINADDDEIVFTSGATESNNFALLGYMLKNKRKGNHVIISEVEHISILNIAKYLQMQGFNVTRVPVDRYGRVSIKKLERRITDQTNEIGTIQPVAEIGKLARERGIKFHTDAVAAEGAVDLDVKRDNIDLMSLSSNDIYGPRGLGVLYIKKGARPNPVIQGGGQEKGLRSGTENMPAIVGMQAAAVKRFRGWRDRMIKQILEEIPDSYLNGHPQGRLASNAHFRFDGIEGESILISFKDEGISVSTGSACSSKTLEPSHTLIATGLLHEEAHGSLQFTVGRFNEDSDIDRALEVVPKVVNRLRKLSPIYKARK